MSRNILYVDDNLDNLNKFRELITNNVVNKNLAIRLDLACGLSTALVRLNNARSNDRDYDLVFADERLESHIVRGDLWGVEYLEQRAKILNPSTVVVEFASGPQYNRRVCPDHVLMKPMIYRAREICDILKITRTREKENA